MSISKIKKKSTKNYNKKMGVPKSAESLFKNWINHYPESDHSTDWELFYMFISILLSRSKIERSSSWLRELIEDNSDKLNQEQIEEYCQAYEHIKNYKKVWKSHTAKLIYLEKQGQ